MRSSQPQARLGPPTIRSGNRAGVLEVIRRNQGISRAELSRHTGLTHAAISNIVGELLEQGLIIEDGQSSAELGRPRIRLTINATRYAVIGVDLARSQIRAIVSDLQGNILRSISAASTYDHPVEITLSTLTELLEQLLADCGELCGRIVGIGVGAPGPLSAAEGTILSPPNFGSWRNVPIKQILEERFGLPVFIDNDANGCALAEGWFGAGRTFEDFIYLAIGTGVGAGIMTGGVIQRGVHGIAGEVGHTTIEVAGPHCTCGNYGCLELYTSATALVQAAQQAMMCGEDTMLTDICAGQPQSMSVEAIAIAARRGDLLSLRLIDQEIQYLGAAIVSLINLLDPQAVFLGREVAQAAGDLLLEPLRALVAKRAFSVAAEQVQILCATLGNDAPVIGAACLVIQELFRSPERVLHAERMPSR
ncbi:MAG: ROK family transcriptional regulator [Caldilineaceae bacterium]|nr:ROK family transcriptional regulator [Caldilineaceae bacterium]